MNKYEVYYSRTTARIDRVREHLVAHGLVWCGIDELIARPDIFPLQGGHSKAERLSWARGMRAAGELFVIVEWYSTAEYRLRAVEGAPPLRYRHISKVWRDCK